MPRNRKSAPIQENLSLIAATLEVIVGENSLLCLLAAPFLIPFTGFGREYPQIPSTVPVFWVSPFLTQIFSVPTGWLHRHVRGACLMKITLFFLSSFSLPSWRVLMPLAAYHVGAGLYLCKSLVLFSVPLHFVSHKWQCRTRPSCCVQIVGTSSNSTI